ncbi:MAG: hypothetical protein ACFHU9_09845 [Fluviicola sp.]
MNKDLQCMRLKPLFVLLLLWISTGNVTGQSKGDTDNSSSFEEIYQSLFDTTRNDASTFRTAIALDSVLKTLPPIDTVQLTLNYGESRKVYFEDSLMLDYKKSWWESGSSNTSSQIIFYRGKPISAKFHGLHQIESLYFLDDSIQVQTRAGSAPLRENATLVLFNFWNRKMLILEYEYSIPIDFAVIHELYPSQIVLIRYPFDLKLVRRRYEPIAEDHLLMEYLDESIPY